MKVLETIGIAGTIGLIIVGAVIGTGFLAPHGIGEGVVGAIVGALAGAFVRLNAMALLEVIIRELWRVFRKRKKHRQQKSLAKSRLCGNLT